MPSHGGHPWPSEHVTQKKPRDAKLTPQVKCQKENGAPYISL